MTAHVVMPPRRNRSDGVWQSSCTCGRWVRHADRQVVIEQMKSCRAKALTPHDSPERGQKTDD